MRGVLVSRAGSSPASDTIIFISDVVISTSFFVTITFPIYLSAMALQCLYCLYQPNISPVFHLEVSSLSSIPTDLLVTMLTAGVYVILSLILLTKCYSPVLTCYLIVYLLNVEITCSLPEWNSLFTIPIPSLKYSKTVEFLPEILTLMHFSNFPAGVSTTALVSTISL